MIIVEPGEDILVEELSYEPSTLQYPPEESYFIVSPESEIIFLGDI